MSGARLEEIAHWVQQAFRDSGIFSRQIGGNLLAQEHHKIDGRSYVVLLGGSSAADHPALSNNDPRRKSLEEYPLRVRGGDEAHVRFALRPLQDGEATDRNEHPVSFAPGENLRRVAVRELVFRVFGLADNPLGVRSLRVEYDPRRTGRPAEEVWLRDWQRRLDENPAHPAWHLHVNSGDPQGEADQRGDFRDEDLRLAIGAPNPLAFILSFAAWYQRALLRGQDRP